jgi:hypothetical protein
LSGTEVIVTQPFGLLPEFSPIIFWRYRLVQQALKSGVKPTAKQFHTSPPVVRFWRDRFQKEGYFGLDDRSLIYTATGGHVREAAV